MRCHCLIRENPHYRRDAFESGLKAAGYSLVNDMIGDVHKDDLLVIWNRYGWFHEEAKRYEAIGARVLVAENGYLGVEFAQDRWYALSMSQHNGAGHIADGSAERWDSLGVELQPWRTGREILVLPQRGIGHSGVAMPERWRGDMHERLKGLPYRVREHPGLNPCVSLEEDLKDAKAVVTWGSGAALKALLLGIPCFHSFAQWIGAEASTLLQWADFDKPQRPERLPMFRKIAWGMWRVSEIADGTAFRALLCTS
jgi:hypothetical protein